MGIENAILNGFDMVLVMGMFERRSYRVGLKSEKSRR